MTAKSDIERARHYAMMAGKLARYGNHDGARRMQMLADQATIRHYQSKAR